MSEQQRSFIVERTQAGYQAYRQAFSAGGAAFDFFLAGRGRASRSGQNLPVGRPANVLNRARARKMRAVGKSLAAISAALQIPISTIRRAVAEPGE